MDDIDPVLRGYLRRIGKTLDDRAKTAKLMDRYYDGDHPVPQAIIDAKATKAYQRLMDLAKSNWPRLIVDSVEERLEVQGVRFSDGEEADKDAWAIWQRNGLDALSGLAHQGALTDGRAFVVVWAGPDGLAEITPEHASTMAIEYADQTCRRRRAAMRRWEEDGKWHATLYLPDGLYKFEAGETSSGVPDADSWTRREIDGEAWPLPNPLGVVPAVELGVNRSLRPGPWGVARGEFETARGHIDRINYTVFAWIVAMTWSGFPLRGLIGDKILRDDDGNPLKPFDIRADELVQIENPGGKLVQLPEANLKGYIDTIEAHIRHLAAITKTPAHYLLGQLVNVSADAIRAADAGHVSKIGRHHRWLGEGWEEAIRLSFRVEDSEDPRGTDYGAEIIWKDPESRSHAERADAASKLTEILPWQALAERILGATPQEIAAWEAMRASDTLGGLIAEPAPA